MATGSGSAKSSSGSTRKKPAARKPAAKKTAAKPAARKPAKPAAKRTAAKTPAARSSAKRAATRRAPSAGRSDKSVQAFREAVDRSVTALESNVTVPRDRLQEVVDDAVERGRITRQDANELVSNLVNRGRKYSRRPGQGAREPVRAGPQGVRLAGSRRPQGGRGADHAEPPAGFEGCRADLARCDRAADPALAEADRVRRRAGVAADAPITAYESLTVPQIRARLADLNTGRAAQGAHPGEARQGPQERSRRDREAARELESPAQRPRGRCQHRGDVRGTDPALARAPDREPSSSSRSTRSPRAGAASPAPTATSSSSPERCRATACARGSRSRSATTREARAVELLRASTERIADRCEHGGEPCPGAPWQGMTYERQLAEKAGQVEDALRRIGRLDGFEVEPIEPASEQWRYRNKLEYSFGAGGEAELALGFHRRGSWSEVVDVDDCMLASEANNAARNEIRDWARTREAVRVRPPRRARRAAQPRRPRGPAHRPDPDPPRHLGRRARRSPPVDLHTVIEGPSGGTDGPTGVLGAEYLAEELGGLRFRDLPRRLLADEHRDGGAPLRDRRRVRRARRARTRLRPVLRDRHDRPLARRRRRARSGASRASRRRSPTRATTPRRTGSTTRSFVAADARARRSRPLIEQAGRPDVIVRRPAARRALREGRPPRARVRGAADRLRLLQPDDAGAERGADGRGRL